MPADLPVYNASNPIKDYLSGVNVTVTVPVDKSGVPLDLTDKVAQVTSVTDGSGTITTGGVSQQVFAVNSARQYCEIQNISTGLLYVNFGASATVDSNSFKLLPNSVYYMNPAITTTVNIIGATTGQAFVAKQG